MRKGDFWITYAFLLVAQLLLSNYLYVTPYVTLSILPVMVMTISIGIGPVLTMLIACVTGLAVDWLSDGVLGLNALSLVPVAFARNGIIRLIFGNELFARSEDFSVTKNGFGKVALAIFLAQLIFLVIYIWADGAGTRPLWFNATRLGASLAAGFVVSLMCLGALARDTRK